MSEHDAETPAAASATTESVQGWSGRCFCGAISYTLSAPPLYQMNCHCRDCQRVTGGPYAPVFVVNSKALNLAGPELKYYLSKGDTGKEIQRGFCSTCGAGILARSNANPDLIAVKAGTLDDASIFKPQLDIFMSSAQPWDTPKPNIPHFPKYPPPPPS